MIRSKTRSDMQRRSTQRPSPTRSFTAGTSLHGGSGSVMESLTPKSKPAVRQAECLCTIPGVYQMRKPPGKPSKQTQILA
jgi:hypothetical protein